MVARELWKRFGSKRKKKNQTRSYNLRGERESLYISAAVHLTPVQSAVTEQRQHYDGALISQLGQEHFRSERCTPRLETYILISTYIHTYRDSQRYASCSSYGLRAHGLRNDAPTR
jgi:hypothetical protein